MIFKVIHFGQVLPVDVKVSLSSQLSLPPTLTVSVVLVLIRRPSMTDCHMQTKVLEVKLCPHKKLQYHQHTEFPEYTW